MKVQSVEELLIEEIKDIYDAEKQLVKALPKMAKAATDEELGNAFQDHLEETKGHVDRLERIFEILSQKPKGKACKGMKGLIEEGSEAMEEDATDEMMDSAIIAAAQRVEHYEMAAYMNARNLAEAVGATEAVELLEETLAEEEEADRKLGEIGKRIIVESSQEESGTEMEEDDESEERTVSARGNSNARKAPGRTGNGSKAKKAEPTRVKAAG